MCGLHAPLEILNPNRSASRSQTGRPTWNFAAIGSKKLAGVIFCAQIGLRSRFKSYICTSERGGRNLNEEHMLYSKSAKLFQSSFCNVEKKNSRQEKTTGTCNWSFPQKRQLNRGTRAALFFEKACLTCTAHHVIRHPPSWDVFSTVCTLVLISSPREQGDPDPTLGLPTVPRRMRTADQLCTPAHCSLPKESSFSD